MPHFEEVYKKYPGQFALVALTIKEEKTDPMAFLKEGGYSFSGAIAEMAALEPFGVSSIPHTFFIDRDGNVVDNVVGGMDSAEFEQRVARLLSL